MNHSSQNFFFLILCLLKAKPCADSLLVATTLCCSQQSYLVHNLINLIKNRLCFYFTFSLWFATRGFDECPLLVFTAQYSDSEKKQGRWRCNLKSCLSVKLSDEETYERIFYLVSTKNGKRETGDDLLTTSCCSRDHTTDWRRKRRTRSDYLRRLVLLPPVERCYLL